MEAKSPSKNLVIVESPAKARTIKRYLGPGFEVAASVGHVRDLPKKELGVDVERDFEPKYVTIRGKGKVLKELRQKADKADSVFLAMDPDREGEAIAYHVAEQLGLERDEDRFKRIIFHEITKRAVQDALEEPGGIDMKKVEAQQARRILDRLVGYKVSPLLWKPIRPGLSAGRVQTVALRLICEREDEIRAFEPEEYWSVTAHLEKDDQPFDARLQKIDGKAFTLGNEEEATAVLADVEGKPFQATSVKRRERRKNPFPPFTTSTLQQEAAKRFRFSARRTMSLAQRLYEGVELGSREATGLITYMRTDSTRVSGQAVGSARNWLEGKFGDRYLPKSPRLYGGKQQKGAQEAHEGIRPTDPTLHPDDVRPHVDDDQARLYELIWLRFMASQMSPAVYDTTTVDFLLEGGDTGRKLLFRATGSVVKFDGFTRLYQEATEVGDHRRLDDMEPLPEIDKGDTCELKELEPKQHFTQPPPRYSEASLVKELEAQGIGRPSTYAQIISTIQDRGYVEMEKRRFLPTELGEVVSELLVRIFPDIFDVEFTSRMEDALDQVEEGDQDWRGLLKGFYPSFEDRLAAGQENSDEIIKEILAAEGETCEVCGRPMQVKWNKYGRFLGCSGYPECKNTRSLDAPDQKEEVLGTDEETGKEIYAKTGPYGPYVQLGEGENGKKPKRVSIPDGVGLADVGLEYARKLLSLPRTVGTDPDSGEEVVTGIGRYGPYVRRGSTFASLRNPEQLFEIGLEDAVALVEAKEKGEKPVIKELGEHPDSGTAVRILDGRYGPYVTDGDTNASIPKGVDPEQVTLEEGLDLLEERKAKGKGRRGRKKGGRKK
ncbi:MAG: type I DNA topoisomerase [Longimicrobiales bacterium]